MARDKVSNKDLEPNPRMRKVLAPGDDNVAILRGFIGPSERGGYIRLFASLADTSISVEIAETDIVDTGDVLNNQLGKRIVWVRKGAQITVIKTRTTEYGVRPKIPADPELAAVRRSGRLHMQVNAPALRDTCVQLQHVREPLYELVRSLRLCQVARAAWLAEPPWINRG